MKTLEKFLTEKGIEFNEALIDAVNEYAEYYLDNKVNRFCFNCKHEKLTQNKEPCKSCSYQSGWEEVE